MKITGTRSAVFIEFDYRTVKIAGELTTTRAFYADTTSIKNWEPPFEQIAVTEEEKVAIIKKVMDQNNPAFEIIFE